MLKEATSLNLFQFLTARKYLEELFTQLKSVRKRYSYEQLSKDLGFSKSSYLFQILAGLRPINEKAAKRIAEAIPLRNEERRYFLALAMHEGAKSASDRQESFNLILEMRGEKLESTLSRRMLQYLSEWYHPVIRELVTMPEFSTNPEWIAARVRPSITPDQAAQSFALLQELGFIVYDVKAQRWRQAESLISMPEDVQSLGLMAYHQQMIQRAEHSVFNVPAELREIEALTFSTSIEEIANLRQKIRQFREQIINDYSECKNSNVVVQLNLQLFPLTQTVNRKGDK